MYFIHVEQFDHFQDLTITRIRKLLRYFHELINRRMLLEKIPITYEQFPLLIITIHREGCSMQEIARIMNQDKSGILRGLRCLELRGLIRFKSDSGDLRKRLVFSTQKARDVSEKILNEVQAFEQDLFAGISARETKTFLKVMDKLSDKCLESGATRFPRYSLAGKQ